MTSTTKTSTNTQIQRIDRRGRVVRSREQREAILDDFEHSAMNGARFAARHNINYKTFGNWMRKRRGERPAASNGTGAPALKQVVIEGRSASFDPSPASIIIRLPGGAIVELSTPEQAALVAELLQYLNRAESC